MDSKQKDHLEDFVKSNRTGFDTEEPSDNVWQNIDKQLRFDQGSSSWGMWLWRAAAVVFFCSTVYLWAVNGNAQQKPEPLAVETSGEDFGKVEQYYFSQINEKQNQIVNYQNKIEVNGRYEVDLQKLDAMYEVLKDELKKNPSNAEVKDALTLNLLVRIDLLNEQLKGIEDSKTETQQQERGV